MELLSEVFGTSIRGVKRHEGCYSSFNYLEGWIVGHDCADLSKCQLYGMIEQCMFNGTQLLLSLLHYLVLPGECSALSG